MLIEMGGNVETANAMLTVSSDFVKLVEKSGATLSISGQAHGLTPSIEATIYRVIQEALTNSLKHAGPNAEPCVTVVWQRELVSIAVTNKMTDYVSTSDNRGLGLIGMSERVAALDGTLTVGPNEIGGYTVCAQIPLQTKNHG